MPRALDRWGQSDGASTVATPNAPGCRRPGAVPCCRPGGPAHNGCRDERPTNEVVPPGAHFGVKKWAGICLLVRPGFPKCLEFHRSSLTEIRVPQGGRTFRMYVLYLTADSMSTPVERPNRCIFSLDIATSNHTWTGWGTFTSTGFGPVARDQQPGWLRMHGEVGLVCGS